MSTSQEFSADSLATDFVAEVEAFLATHNMPPTKFSVQAARDPGFMRNLRAGRSPSLKKADEVRRFMRGYQPAPANEAAE